MIFLSVWIGRRASRKKIKYIQILVATAASEAPKNGAITCGIAAGRQGHRQQGWWLTRHMLTEPRKSENIHKNSAVSAGDNGVDCIRGWRRC